MSKASPTLNSTLQERYQNMVASFRIEGIELDEPTRMALDQVLAGKLSAVDLEQRILADYAGTA